MITRFCGIKCGISNIHHNPFRVGSSLSSQFKHIQVLQCQTYLLQIFTIKDQKRCFKYSIVICPGMVVLHLFRIIVEQYKSKRKIKLKGCFPLSGIFHAEQNSSLYLSSQAELIRRRQRKIPLRAEYSA